GAAVPLEHRAGLLVIARLPLPEHLGLDCTAQRRPVDDVAEEDGDRAAARGHEPSLGRSHLHFYAVLDSLSDKLQPTLDDLHGRGRLDEETISRAMREIRLALLEADVNFQVVK